MFLKSLITIVSVTHRVWYDVSITFQQQLDNNEYLDGKYKYY
ncbi:hypothetical protein [Ureaplasma urealyticum]|nr:hypothetical protein [Ureaplasma urealyticum]